MTERDERPREAASVLVVDDDGLTRRIVDHMLRQEGHTTVLAEDGHTALELLARRPFDIVLLDIRMPGMDGYEVCTRIRQTLELQALPIVMMTAEGQQEKLAALRAGADDFVVKPVERSEFLARIRSLLRIKRYHDTIVAQRAQLATLARTLEQRVDQQVQEIERLGRLRRFLSPQVADVLVSADDRALEAHRRFIAVCFCELRGFGSFIEAAEPEEVIGVLGEFYETVGAVIMQSQATVGDLAGDGIVAYFNDPLPCPEPERSAAGMALAIRDRMRAPASSWRKLGHDLDLAIGVAAGYATLGMTGFDGRFEYKPFGTVVNLAARLCAAAGPGQILLSQRVCAAIERAFRTETLGDAALKGIKRRVPLVALVGRCEHDGGDAAQAEASR